MVREFKIIGLSLPGTEDAGVPVAVSMAGGIGLLDLVLIEDSRKIVDLLDALRCAGRAHLGVRVSGRQVAGLNIPPELDTILLTDEPGADLPSAIAALKRPARTVLLEATTLESAEAGERAGADGVIAKGNEAAGWVGMETTFILLQRLLQKLRVPVWAQGGMGLHTAAASYGAGAAGVVLDTQLALTRESSIDATSAAILKRMDGSETVCLGESLGAACRLFGRDGPQQVEELRRIVQELGARLPPDPTGWREQLNRDASRANSRVWFIGQDAAFAAPLAAQFPTVQKVLDGFRAAVGEHVATAKRNHSLSPGSPLAAAHGTRYPIVQGPMTRVSDVAAFACEVAAGGGLPFLALALMRAPEASVLLDQVTARLGDRPWGVGILGFVPPDLRQEQMEVVAKHRPPFALIAGGRPDQCGELDRLGVRTYLHVPSPALLRVYWESGARRFVFEGRECGGHVGPRSSFVLWNSMVDVLLAAVPRDQAGECHVLFAGGIHDARSAAMVAILSAPLAALGVRTGVLLGTAYLFTREAVSTGAIAARFQQEALRCAGTVLLESGPGHAIRCVNSPFANFFDQEKASLRRQGKPVDEIRTALEELNVGRLRIASKGLRRIDSGPGQREFASVSAEEQWSEGMYMIGQAATLHREVGSIAELHDEVSVRAQERIDMLPLPSTATTTPSPPRDRRDGVAIVGMSCLFPKAPDLPTFWANVLNKTDAITEIPPGRWDWRRYFSDDPKARDKISSRWGGFLGEIVFDPVRHGMPPSSIPSTEPLQLLTLEAVRRALDDAGYADRPFQRDRTAVILGVGGGTADLGLQYAVRATLPMYIDPVPPGTMANLPEWTENTFPGILTNVVAGRVANRFDLGGVNYTVDAACASSLAALYQAVHELESGTSDVVITGGADTLQSPFAYLCFSKTSALSPRGRCRTFDETADGIAIAEGIVILVLKRLADAERDGDRIYAIVKGVAGSSDGKDKGLTAPRREGQIRALERAYEQAGISPATVGLVEAHGTGTVVGDRVEIEALTDVYARAGADARSCAIGSVKSMIGHSKSTAGVAGLAKAALALHHQVLPPTFGVTKPNSAFVPQNPFYVNSETRPWIRSPTGAPRRAAVSAFGFGGTNFHAVLEEYAGPKHEDVASGGAWPGELMLFGADSVAKLQASVRSLAATLKRGAAPRLLDLAYTLFQRTTRPTTPSSQFKLAILANSLSDLLAKISLCDERLSAGSAPPWLDAVAGIYFSGGPASFTDKVALLFPGQGSQYPEMAGELALHFREVRGEFETANRVLAGRFSRPLSNYVFSPPRFNEEENRSARQVLTRTEVAQPALGAADFALFRLLEKLGVRADMAAGHSYGEYVALCAAGVFPETVLYDLSEARGRIISESAAADRGGMAAVEADRETVARLLRDIDSVWIANLNAPDQTVISGTAAGLKQAASRADSAGLKTRTLAVSCAFHSPLVARARDRLAARLSGLEFSAPRFPVFSNATCTPHPTDPAALRAALSNHLVSPVDFVGEVESMYAAGARVFLETGPRNVLTDLTGRILHGRPHTALALELPGRGGLTQLQQTLGHLFALGVALKFDVLYRGRKAQALSLDTLFEDTRAPVLPQTAWLVDGGRARPAHVPKEASKPAAFEANGHGPNGSAPPHVGPFANKNPERPLTPLPMPTPPATNREAADAIHRFQEVMNKVLDTQREVMLAYLHSSANGSAGPATPWVPDRVGLPVAQAKSPTPTSPVTEAAPAPPPTTSMPVIAIESAEPSIQQRLLGIVSERTGYPQDVLGLDQKIEADLGVDSLKVSEILAVFQQSCRPADQRLVSGAMDKLTKARTLGAMIDLLGSILNGAPAKNRSDGTHAENGRASLSPIPAAVASAPPTEVPRYRLQTVDATRIADRSAIAGSFLITDDELGFAARVTSELLRDGVRVSRVRHGRGFTTHASHSYTADLADPMAVSRLLDAVRQAQGPLAGLIHLLPLKPGAALEKMDLGEIHGRLDLDIKSLFLLAGAISADLKSSATAGRACLLAATAMGGAGGTEASAAFAPGHGGIAGMLRCLALEWPGVRCKAVDFERGQPVELLASRIIAEISSRDDVVVVGYPAARRVVLRAAESPRAERERAGVGVPRVDSESVILVTGGGRGITAEVARDLASRYRPTLLIVGRTAEAETVEDPTTAGLNSPAEIKAALFATKKPGQNFTPAEAEAECSRRLRQRELRENLRAMREAGATVRYFAADVRDQAAFGGLIASLYETYGRIDGVIHGAGVIEDKLIEDKNADSFARVLETKVGSAFILSRSLRPDSVRFFVFFSSVAASFGNRGQADYGAANAMLDHLAIHLDHAWPGNIFSVNWGPWAKTGMVSAAMEAQFRERGIELIPPAAGAAALDWELRHREKGKGNVIIGRGPWAAAAEIALASSSNAADSGGEPVLAGHNGAGGIYGS